MAGPRLLNSQQMMSNRPDRAANAMKSIGDIASSVRTFKDRGRVKAAQERQLRQEEANIGYKVAQMNKANAETDAIQSGMANKVAIQTANAEQFKHINNSYAELVKNPDTTPEQWQAFGVKASVLDGDPRYGKMNDAMQTHAADQYKLGKLHTDIAQQEGFNAGVKSGEILTNPEDVKNSGWAHTTIVSPNEVIGYKNTGRADPATLEKIDKERAAWNKSNPGEIFESSYADKFWADPSVSGPISRSNAAITAKAEAAAASAVLAEKSGVAVAEHAAIAAVDSSIKVAEAGEMTPILEQRAKDTAKAQVEAQNLREPTVIEKTTNDPYFGKITEHSEKGTASQMAKRPADPVDAAEMQSRSERIAANIPKTRSPKDHKVINDTLRAQYKTLTQAVTDAEIDAMDGDEWHDSAGGDQEDLTEAQKALDDHIALADKYGVDVMTPEKEAVTKVGSGGVKSITEMILKQD